MQNATPLSHLGSNHFEFSGKKTNGVLSYIHGIREKNRSGNGHWNRSGLDNLLKNFDDVSVSVYS